MTMSIFLTILIVVGGLFLCWCGLMIFSKSADQNEDGWAIAGFIFGCVVLCAAFGGSIVGIVTVWADNRPVIGTVVGKRHTAAYSTTTYIMSGNVLVPIQHNEPEHWTVIVQQGTDERGVYVSDTLYKDVQIGEQWPRSALNRPEEQQP